MTDCGTITIGETDPDDGGGGGGDNGGGDGDGGLSTTELAIAGVAIFAVVRKLR